MSSSCSSAVRKLFALPELPPKCAERFDVVRALGTGGFGTVWLARHRELGRLVALKLLHTETARQPAAFARFLNEARVTAMVKHPHIVRLLDHDVEDGRPWIAYEYLGDVTLQTELDRRGALGVAGGLLAAIQLAEGLEAAHAAGVVHRDLKPENVLAVEPGLYKLIDFGVAAGSGGLVRTGVNQIMGTPAYLTPEQLRCEGASPLTDQYQLGLLLYQMITGVVPHKDESLQTLLVRRATCAPVPPSELVSGVSHEVDAAVMRMLALKPRDRFENMRAVRHALEAAASRPRRHAPTVRVRARNMAETTAKVLYLPRPPGMYRALAVRMAFQLAAMACGGLLFLIML